MVRIVFYCGAGVSVDSGLPAFRAGEDAVWDNHKVDDVCNFGRWKNAVRDDTVSTINAFYEAYRRKVKAAEPNDFHRFVASHGDDAYVLTSNVDDLFERAGVPQDHVIHLHGSINKWRCTACNRSFEIAEGNEVTPSRCPREKCRSRYIKTDVAFYGEACAKSYAAGVRLFNAVRRGDVLIMSGSSGTTFGIAQVKWFQARARYVATVQINPDPAVHVNYPGQYSIEKGATEGLDQVKKIVAIYDW